MGGALGIAVFIGLVAWSEVPGLWKRRRWRELIIFGCFLLGSAYFFVLGLYVNRLPNPLRGLEWIFRSVGSLFRT